VEAMIAADVEDEVQRAHAAGASRTARAAIGFDELLAGDVEAMKAAQRRYARRQLTWMRKMSGVQEVDRTGQTDEDVADQVLDLLESQR
jgi:tRNA dimethylallyltransferase